MFRNGIRHGLACDGIIIKSEDIFRRRLIELAKRHDLQRDYVDADLVVYRNDRMAVIGKMVS
jgi:hypothetical protein